jgi:hypothetical protein
MIRVCETCQRSFAHGRPANKGRFCSHLCWRTYRLNELRATSSERFWAKVSVGSDSDCWIWKYGRNNTGYGELSFNGKRQLAHRVAYSLHHDISLPTLYVLHACDNPPCCNPSHLFLGTQKDNMRDCKSKSRARNKPRRGEQHHKAKITAEDAKTIRVSDEPTALLSARYGLGYSSIQRIKSGSSWKSLLGEST